MAAAFIKSPLVIERGMSLSRIITITLGGTAANLTDCNATLNIYRGSPAIPGNIALSANTNTNTRLTVYSANAGQLQYSLSDTETDDLATGDYWQELVIFFAAGSVRRAFVRPVQVTPTGHEDVGI